MKLKKLLSLLASVVVATSASASVIACGTFINGEKGTEQKRSLENDLRVHDLGDFDNTPNDTELLKRVLELNPDVDKKSVTIIKTGDGTAQVSPTLTGVYAQDRPIDVKYSVGQEQSKRDLHELFRNKSVVDLGSVDRPKPLTMTDLEFVKSEIIKRKLLKPGVELDYNQLDVIFSNDQTITIKPKPDSTSYIKTSKVELTYTIAPSVKTDLGILDGYPTKELILKKFQYINIDGIKAEQFDVTKIDAKKGTARLELKLDEKTGKNKFYDKNKLGIINVSYQLALDKIISETNLGRLADNINGRDKAALLDELNARNDNKLNVDELDLIINPDGEAKLIPTGNLYVSHLNQNDKTSIIINYQFNLKYAIQDKLHDTLILNSFYGDDE